MFKNRQVTIPQPPAEPKRYRLATYTHGPLTDLTYTDVEEFPGPTGSYAVYGPRLVAATEWEPLPQFLRRLLTSMGVKLTVKAGTGPTIEMDSV